MIAACQFGIWYISVCSALSTSDVKFAAKQFDTIVVFVVMFKTLFRRRHFQVSGANLNPSSSSSDILILSSNCTFDTVVVLVVIFIT